MLTFILYLISLCKYISNIRAQNLKANTKSITTKFPVSFY